MEVAVSQDDREKHSTVKGTPNTPFRERLGCFIHSKTIQVVSVCLLLTDAILVLVLLLVDLDVIPVSGPRKKEQIEDGLHYTGLTILSIFMVEIIIKIVADGSRFFKKKLEVFDAVVVVVSFALDISLSLSHVSNLVRDVVILMILLRLWRFFKLLVSVNTCARRDVHMKLEKEKERRIQAERERDDALENLRLTRQQSPGSESHTVSKDGTDTASKDGPDTVSKDGTNTASKDGTDTASKDGHKISQDGYRTIPIPGASQE